MVELVIAIGLVALVVALALPASVGLLEREGRRSVLFSSEAALREARARAMREGTPLEIGARETDEGWTLVVREIAAPTIDRASDEGAEDEPAWDRVLTLPRGFAFAFEPQDDPGGALQPSEPPAPGEPEPTRVGIALPDGALTCVDSWRLVIEEREPTLSYLLRVRRWTGTIEAQLERSDGFEAVLEPDAPTPEPEGAGW